MECLDFLEQLAQLRVVHSCLQVSDWCVDTSCLFKSGKSDGAVRVLTIRRFVSSQ